MMQEYLSHFEFLVVASTLVGGWLKFQADYNKLSSRVHTLKLTIKNLRMTSSSC